MLCITLLYTGCARSAVRETAVQLLHLLYKRFYFDNISAVQEGAEGKENETVSTMDQQTNASVVLEKKVLQEALLCGSDSRSQKFIAETLSQLLPDLTMPVFSG